MRLKNSWESVRKIGGLDDPSWVSFLKKWMALSLILHLIAGVMSVGFYDMDEHFQILEFLAYKMGKAPVSDLAVEFPWHCRSFFQPTLYEGITRFWLALGIDSPAFWAASFRLFSSGVGWLSTLLLCLCSYSWLDQKKSREWLVRVSTLLYCIPYLHARPSSEGLGGSFFFIGLGIFVLFSGYLGDRVRTKPLLTAWIAAVTGVFFGLGFLSRFQMGFTILGFGVWALFLARVPFLKLCLMAGGFLAVLGLGVLVDWRGYGIWTFTGYDYFKKSLLDGQAASSGVSPWWDYLVCLGQHIGVIGYLLAAGVMIAWVVRPKNTLVLPSALFFIGHSAVGHKEYRYLFPLISAVPVLFMMGVEWVKKQFPRWVEIRPVIWVRNLLIAVNIGGLIVASLKPVRPSPLIQNYVFDHRDEISKLYFIEPYNNPFRVINMQMHFYRPSGLQVIGTDRFENFEKILKESSEPLYLFYHMDELPNESGGVKPLCQRIYTVFPNFLRPLLFLQGLKGSSKFSIYKCSI